MIKKLLVARLFKSHGADDRLVGLSLAKSLEHRLRSDPKTDGTYIRTILQQFCPYLDPISDEL